MSQRLSGFSAAVLVVGLVAGYALSAGAGQTTGAAVESFEFTGESEDWTVPEDVCEVTVVAHGAEGGEGLNLGGNSSGGLGGQAEADIAVEPSEVLTVTVGGEGADATEAASGAGAGGFNGGGDGGEDQSDEGAGGGGGGMTDLRRGSEVLVAAGGGGGGGGGQDEFVGGDGGDGGGTGTDGEGVVATGADGGRAGGNGGEGGDGGGTGDDGDDGTPGAGGDGGDAFNEGGGGGGGGFLGGGGGGGANFSSSGAGGGGGGSGFTPDDLGQTNGVRAGDGALELRYVPEPGCDEEPVPEPAPDVVAARPPFTG